MRVTQADLRGLEARLARAAELAAGYELDIVAEYRQGAELVGALAARLPSLPAEERERLELNADLPQLDFHLGEELARAERLDRAALAGSLAFMRRHLVRLRAEWLEQAHLRVDPVDRELAIGLARLTRLTYHSRFAHHYDEAGYRRPFVDKLYRDYSLTGIPGPLLAELADVALEGSYDGILCVLKGGLPYTLLLELLGAVAPVHHLMCGRASGSHVTPTYLVQPLDFDFADLAGKRVLVVDNNAATGATLTHLSAALGDVPGLRADLFLDYIVAEFGPLDEAALSALGFRRLRIGPFTGPAPDPGLRSSLLRATREGLRQHESVP